MQGLLVSPYGIPELRCTPRMGSIEIDIENPVSDTYLFTYTPFNGEPLYTASSVDLFTFERPTEEEGSSELRVRASPIARCTNQLSQSVPPAALNPNPLPHVMRPVMRVRPIFQMCSPLAEGHA